jgi:hypothetical protein
MSSAVMVALFAGAFREAPGEALPVLPARVKRIVLHTLGGPFYGQPEMRWRFFEPRETLARWKRPRFGAHWIVWTDGSIWPRHPAPEEGPSFAPPDSGPTPPALARRVAREAGPVYSHVAGHNSATVGIEVAHSGRSDDPIPEAQARATAWLVSLLLELSEGRLRSRDVVGHKDLDRKPAYVGDRCNATACLAFVDAQGRPFRRRVDPPESLFAALAAHGIVVPRAGSEGDAELARASAIPAGEVPMSRTP